MLTCAVVMVDDRPPPHRRKVRHFDHLNHEILRIVKTPQFAEQFAPEGIVPVGNTPEQFTQIMIADIAKWAKVIRAAGIRGE